MDFPKFAGKFDPVAFVNQCDSYFRRERIMEDEKVWLVSRNLEDDARVWFLQVQHDEGTPAWRRFTELLHLRFKSPPCPTYSIRYPLASTTPYASLLMCPHSWIASGRVSR